MLWLPTPSWWWFSFTVTRYVWFGQFGWLQVSDRKMECTQALEQTKPVGRRWGSKNESQGSERRPWSFLGLVVAMMATSRTGLLFAIYLIRKMNVNITCKSLSCFSPLDVNRIVSGEGAELQRSGHATSFAQQRWQSFIKMPHFPSSVVNDFCLIRRSRLDAQTVMIAIALGSGAHDLPFAT